MIPKNKPVPARDLEHLRKLIIESHSPAQEGTASPSAAEPSA